MNRTTTKILTSLDRQTRVESPYREIDRRQSLLALESPGCWIARGAGVSYTALGFGAGAESVAMGRMRRVLSFDVDSRQIRVEAGISLGDVFEITAPHRLYLPVQPGHPQISVGGAIACDVHGKNPARDGLFHNQVRALELFHPEFGLRCISRATEPDLLELTCGGYGLTGVIVSATLDLVPMPSPRVRVRTLRISSLADTFEKILALAGEYDFLYTWNDLSRFDEALGRGYLSVAAFDADTAGQFPVTARRYFGLDPSSGVRPRIRLVNRVTIPAIARAHYAMATARESYDTDLWNVLYPGARQAFYFDLYGGAGFFGHMVLIPEDVWREYVVEFERIVRQHRVPLVLAAIKRFDGEQRLLRFDGRGFSFHIHIPNSAGGRRLLADLERLAVESSAVRTPYFDAHLNAVDARVQYGELEEFVRRLRRADPSRSFRSPLSRRLEL